MASVYTRRFLFDPGTTVLLNIESVNVLDLTPPAAIQGVGTSTAMVVGEFEDGPFNAPTPVLSSTDFPNVWGALGYTVNGNPCQYPSASLRYADAAITPENWNGNGFLALNGKQFSSLVVCRVNTSVGSVTLTNLAYVTGTVSATVFNLGTSGATFITNTGSAETTTFTGTVATVDGTGAAFGAPASGAQMVLSYDGNAPFTVYFQTTDTTALLAAARINQYAGYTMASVVSSELVLVGRLAGTAGSVDIISLTTGLGAILGLTVANTAGTGNVPNILAVPFATVQTLIQAADATVSVQLDQNGFIRVSNKATPSTGTITIGAGTGNAALGFASGQAGTAVIAATSAQVGQTIPAGTVVSDGGSTNVFVTMQTTPIVAGQTAYSIPVRYAVDNDTGAGVSGNVITTVVNPPLSGSFAATNPLPLSAALTETQIDAAYVSALAQTVSTNNIGKTINIAWAARHSNTVRSALRTNALSASAGGCYGRMACVSPPLNTASSVALGSAAPGVSATSDQRVIYCYIGASTFVPLIASTGTVAGGIGFTANGYINQTSDGWMASILSQLPPEENPGQDTPFTSQINGLETGPNVQNFQVGDYQAFKAAGIAALRWDYDNGIAIFQSGVTSVNPQTSPALVRVSRRRMADFIQDSIAAFSTGFGKKLSTKSRRRALASEITAFLDGLLGANQPGTQRINGYTVDATSGNTPALLQQGLYRIIINVQTLVSLDSIVLQTDIGDQVVVVTELPAAA